MTHIYVVMSNDYPAAAFSGVAVAEAYAREMNKKDEAEFPHRRIFWNVYPLLLNKATPTSLDLQTIASLNG